MRASQNKAILSSWGDPTACRLHLESHRRRLQEVRPVVDLAPPASIEAYNHGEYPMKKTLQSQAEVEKVTKDNLLLAKRIFAIMEGPGMISALIKDNQHLERHPGTLNFNQRLFEARRIHNENIAFASRLDSMKPFYGKEETALLMKMRRSYRRNKRARDTPFVKGLHQAMKTTKKSPGKTLNSGIDASKIPSNSNQSGQPQHVLLEYSKIQDNRVLEVAVIKEPFRDRFVIFGIDIENGQRFELRLSSDDVSSILDGDILVTSVDHIEVWMALLQKVRLLPVDAFSKLTGINDDEDALASKTDSVSIVEKEAIATILPETVGQNTQQDSSVFEAMKPTAPTQASTSTNTSPRTANRRNQPPRGDPSSKPTPVKHQLPQPEASPKPPTNKSASIRSPRAQQTQQTPQNNHTTAKPKVVTTTAVNTSPKKQVDRRAGNPQKTATLEKCKIAANITVQAAIHSALTNILNKHGNLTS